MNFSSDVQNKLLQNKLNLNNGMNNYIKAKSQNENINNLQLNLLKTNKPISLKKFSIKDNYHNNNGNKKRMNIKNDINIRSNTYRNDLNSLNNMRNQINPPDERLIYCIKMLGLKNFYWNFFHKNYDFEDFLAISNEDMNEMKIPENVQIIIQNFIMNYLNFGSLYSLEELINFFKVNKFKRNNEIKKRVINNNYIDKQDKIMSINKGNKYNIKLNNKKYSKSATPTKKNSFYQNQKQNKYNNKYNDNKEEINKINNSNQNRKDIVYNINIMHNKNPSYENINGTNFQNVYLSNNYANKNGIDYRAQIYSEKKDNFAENNNIKNKKIRNQSANYFQNNLNDYNILNLKTSYKNLYANKFNQNDFNSKNVSLNLNSKFIKTFDNHSKQITFESERENKNNNNGFINKQVNKNKNNLNIKTYKTNSKKIINNKTIINNQNDANNSSLEQNKNKNNSYNRPIKKPQINIKQIYEKDINHFRSRKNHNQKDYNINLNNIINVSNSKVYTSRNMNNNKFNNFINYTETNDIYSFNSNLTNLYVNSQRDKEINKNSKNQLPIKINSNINREIQNYQSKKNTNRINKTQYNNGNNQNDKYIKSNFHSKQNLQNNSMKITNKRKKLELLKKEINELYNKMQMANFIEDNNKKINPKNLKHQRNNIKNNFSKSVNNFIDINDL